MLEEGVVRSRHETTTPPAPRLRVPFARRRGSFDVATYDRLTVLTREIRRLVNVGVAVTLHIGPETYIGNEKVEAMLRWV